MLEFIHSFLHVAIMESAQCRVIANENGFIFSAENTHGKISVAYKRGNPFRITFADDDYMDTNAASMVSAQILVALTA